MMTGEARQALWRLAAGQRGYFAAAQAVDSGYSYQAQYHNVRHGNWVRVARGVYRFKEYLDLPAERHDYLVRWFLWSGRRAVVSHESALAVHDLGVANPTTVHLSVPRGFRQRDPAVSLHRALLRDDEVEQRPGFQVTTQVRAIAETAADYAAQDVIDSAVADVLARGAATRRQIIAAAAHLGPVAATSVEHALEAVGRDG